MKIDEVKAHLDKCRITDQHVAAIIDGFLEFCLASKCVAGPQDRNVWAYAIAWFYMLLDGRLVSRLDVVLSSLFAIYDDTAALLQFFSDKINDPLFFWIDSILGELPCSAQDIPRLLDLTNTIIIGHIGIAAQTLEP